MTGRRRNSLWLYILFGVVELASLVFHFRSVEQMFPGWFGITRAEWPFLLGIKDTPQFSLAFLSGNAQRAGLGSGDQLVAINGAPVRSMSDFANVLANSKAGSAWDVRRRTQDRPDERSARVLLQPAVSSKDPIVIFLYAVMPAFCLALGFWVVAVRIRDIRAWLLLFFLLSAATGFDSFPYLWGPGLRLFGVLYRGLFDPAGIACLFLLGLYFPEPFPGKAGWPWWRWLAWVLLPASAFLLLADLFSSVLTLYSLRAAVPFHVFVSAIPFSSQLVYSVLAVSFLACIATKYRLASSEDVKRRLRVLTAGSALGLLPLSLFFAIERLKGVTEGFFPTWVRIPVYLSFFLLPIVLAYVIVVQRALDVRVVLRQGVQYTLASRGIILLQLVLSTGLFFFVVELTASHSASAAVTLTAIAAGVAALVILQAGRKRLALWIDRRFFRDAYDAEQILSDLSDQVRTMVEVKPLLEVVAGRIASALHVKQLAVLLKENDAYKPCYAIGFDPWPQVILSTEAATIRLLQNEKRPTRIYLDDPNSWLNHPGIQQEEQNQVVLLKPELLLPLSAKEELLGFMSLGQKLSEAPFSNTDLRLLSSVATQTGLALEVARLTDAIGQEIAVRERLNRELEIAREVQEHLFPQHLPAIPRLDYGGLCRPAREVGGDYYDFLGLPGGKLGVAIGDVSGKGIGAALMMANLCASLRGQASVAESLPHLVGAISKLLYGASSANRYATFFYSEFDPETFQLSYVNAGHNPPVIVRRSESACQVFRLPAGGPPVGLLPNTQYEGGMFALQPGDRVVLFTDGISESMNKDDEEWGEEKLIAVAQSAYPSADEAVHRIMAAAQAFAGSTPQHDDMTVVAFQILSA